MSDFIKRGFTGFVLLFLLGATLMGSSCVSTKKMVYFRDLPDTISKSVEISSNTPYTEPRIEPNDLLSISVTPLLQSMASNPVTTNTGNPTTGSGQLPTFAVDKDGYIEYSLIGRVKVGGLTTTEARDVIKERAKEYYIEPVVNIRITNFQITVLGDVPRPGIFFSSNEKFNIIDAIANAGDLNLTSKRDNILLVRSVGDQKICARYDISTSKIFQHPYFYLKQNDMIYVEPNKFKMQSSDQTFVRNLGILSSIISIASLIVVFKSIK